jgi:ketosteroid isomerase-like protein
MQAAAEARRPAAVVEWVSEDFIGSHGLDREQLRRLLQAQMFGNQQVGVTLGPLDVQMHGEQATVRFVALTTGGSGRLLPDRARGYRVVSQWQLEDGQWRVYHAEWVVDPSAG